MCKNIPQDVLVYWTGPVVRSRRIKKSQVEDWTRITGRKPFLWDNTIYAHFQPYWVGYAFNPFSNEFPDDFPDLLAGPGIHLNANAGPHYAPGMLTFADYMWNPEAYDPERSIKTALRLCWGEEAPEAAQDVQYRLIEIYRMLYNARKSSGMIDRERADEMLSELGESVKKLSEIANDPVLAAYLDSNFATETRKAVENFRPDKK